MTYTADDFAKARFSEHEFGAVAARAFPGSNCPWLLPQADERRSDDEMVISGWSPVREAEGGVTLHTVKVAQSNAEKKRQKLLDHIASLEAVIRRRNDQIERQEDQIAKLTDERDAYGRTVDGLRDELREKAVPLSLDALEAAWENAERAGECRKGDVLIRRDDYGGYKVYPAASDGPIATARILSRAPRREPWADLADMLRGTAWEQMAGMDADAIAETLHERGVRVTGGEEK